MTNSDFLTIFCHVLLPVAYEVNQLIFLRISQQVSFFIIIIVRVRI